jgi:micrococcal nuclease
MSSMRIFITFIYTLSVFVLRADEITISGKVVKFYDGDTITVLDANRIQHKIRLNGIDAPERGQDFGGKATQALKSAVGDKNVVVNVASKDRYGRSIGVVMVGQTNVNALMVEKGWAWHYKRYSSDGWLAELELRARTAKVGLWADLRPPVAPWDYRLSQRVKSGSKKVLLGEERKLWLNTSSSVRHNQSCRMFGSTKNGRPCSKTEGKACGICGG